MDYDRDSLLSDIARGVRRVDADRGEWAVPLWRVEVALLDGDGDTLRVASLVDVLGWLADGIHTDSDCRATRLDEARTAHVLLRESRCNERGCDGEHRETSDDDSDDEDSDAEPERRVARCRRCGLRIHEVVEERGPAWSGSDGPWAADDDEDYGCSASPETYEDGVGSHEPVDIRVEAQQQ